MYILYVCIYIYICIYVCPLVQRPRAAPTPLRESLEVFDGRYIENPHFD